MGYGNIETAGIGCPGSVGYHISFSSYTNGERRTLPKPATRCTVVLEQLAAPVGAV